MKIFFLTTLLILSIYSFKYHQSCEKLEVALEENEQNIEDLNNMISICEKIGSIKNRIINYFTPQEYFKIFGNDYAKIQMSDDIPKKYLMDIDYLNYKISKLTTNSALFMDKWKIRKDVLTGELMLGTYIESRIVADAEELLINGRKIEMDYSGLLKIPMSDELHVEFLKYTYDYCEMKIDTLSLTRTIVNE